MKIKHSLLILSLAILVFLLAGCQPKTPAEQAYWQYYEACNSGDFNAAQNFVAESSLNAMGTLGVCAFTHDAINTYEAQRGKPARTFSQDPEVQVHEQRASMTWVDDLGNLAIIQMSEINGEWKVTEATWSQ